MSTHSARFVLAVLALMFSGITSGFLVGTSPQDKGSQAFAFVVPGFSRALLAQGLGTPITEAEIAPWDISILPDGTGLPPGSGTPQQGAKIFAAKCAACHGESGKGGVAAAIVGG